MGISCSSKIEEIDNVTNPCDKKLGGARQISFANINNIPDISSDMRAQKCKYINPYINSSPISNTASTQLIFGIISPINKETSKSSINKKVLKTNDMFLL